MRPGNWLRPSEIPWIAYRITRRAVFSALPLGLHFRIARTMGVTRRRIHGVPDRVLQNMRSCDIGQELDRGDLECLARRHVEFLSCRRLARVLPTLPRFKEPGRWPVQGLAHLDAALRQGRGVILASAHFGFVRMIPAVLRLHGYDVMGFVAEENRLRAERERRRLEAGSTIGRYVHRWTKVTVPELGPRDATVTLDVRPIVAALSGNQPVYLAADGLRSLHFTMVPFLGRSFPFVSGYMKIAEMTGAAVLPVFAVEGDPRYPVEIEVEAPLEIGRGSDLDQGIRQYAARLESRIRRAPHLWDRWTLPNLFDRVLDWTEGDLASRYTARLGE